MKNTDFTPKKETYSKIIITQAVCVALALLALLSAKLFFKTDFSQIKEWYISNFSVDTDINQVLETAGEIGDINEV